jgi:hypothetical protein
MRMRNFFGMRARYRRFAFRSRAELIDRAVIVWSNQLVVPLTPFAIQSGDCAMAPSPQSKRVVVAFWRKQNIWYRNMKLQVGILFAADAISLIPI